MGEVYRENVLAIRLRNVVISANVPGNNVLLEGVTQTALSDGHNALSA